MQFLWKYIDDLVGKGIEWHIIAKLLIYMSTTFVPLALPLAILLSSLMTFGNLGENYELVAMKAAGISLRKVMMPLIILSIIISIAAYYFSNYIMPIANLKAQSLLFDVREQKPSVNIKEGIFYNEIDNYTIKIGKKDDDGKTIHNVMIYDHTRRNGNTNITVAESGKMEFTEDNRFLIFTLYNGNNYVDRAENRKQIATKPFQRTKFQKEYRRIDLSAFRFQKTNEELFKDHYKMLNVKQLQKSIDSVLINAETKKEEFSSLITDNYRYFSMFDENKAEPEKSTAIKTQQKTNRDNKKASKDSTTKKMFLPHSRERINLELDISPVQDIPEKVIDTSAKLKKPFLSNFNKEEKTRITEIALNSARNLKTNIDWTKSDYYHYLKQINKYEIEWHRKFALSFACFVLFFIGAPLGAIIRKGGLGLPVVISVLLFIVFHIISITAEKFVKEFVITPFQGMWLASAILLPVGIFLTVKATTDSAILDIEAWVKFFKKILFIKK